VDDEDSKLLSLARAARARASTDTAAAVRDETGRTYVAVPVNLPSLQLTAIQLAVAMSRASGATSLEAAVLVGADDIDDADLAVLRDVRPDMLLYLAGADDVRQRPVGR
jgi:hypothetical protein